MNIARCTRLVVLALGLGCVACSSTADNPQNDQDTGEPPLAAQADLGGTRWELTRIQSMDDRRWEPDDPSRYTLSFDAGGQALMQLDCNRGRSTWSSERNGQLLFGPTASTNALCGDEGLSERYAAQFEYVRSYLIRDGRLFLATYADGAILEFRQTEHDDTD